MLSTLGRPGRLLATHTLSRSRLVLPRAAARCLTQTAIPSPHIKLSQATLPALQQRGVPVPSFNRNKSSEGIVHFGVGGFHRSHLAQYVNRLADEHQVLDWCICGVGTMPTDAAMRDALKSQDYLYTLVERSQKGTNSHVVGSITSYLFAPGNPDAVIAKLADSSTRIASLTITEGGYFYDPATFKLDFSNPAIAADIRALTKGSSSPQTVYGYLLAALARRRKAGLPPFTVMSCDNIIQNGHLVKKMLLTFAYAVDADLARWIDDNGAFPNSMVDRITPRTTPNDTTDILNNHGYLDKWPVVTEPFSHWVIEDQFSAGRPNWQLVGAQVVPDVEPYEKMKMRLLNGNHSALAYLGYLAGHQYVHDTMGDPTFRTYIRSIMDKEVLPLIPQPPGIHLSSYCDTLFERFGNPIIADTLRRICLDGSGKMPNYVLPSVQEQLARGGDFNRLTLSVAAWFRYLAARDENGKEYTVEDPMANELVPLAREGGADPTKLLSLTQLFSEDLRSSPAFVESLTHHLQSLYQNGARATLEKLVAKDVQRQAIPTILAQEEAPASLELDRIAETVETRRPEISL